MTKSLSEGFIVVDSLDQEELDHSTKHQRHSSSLQGKMERVDIGFSNISWHNNGLLSANISTTSYLIFVSYTKS